MPVHAGLAKQTHARVICVRISDLGTPRPMSQSIRSPKEVYRNVYRKVYQKCTAHPEVKSYPQIVSKVYSNLYLKITLDFRALAPWVSHNSKQKQRVFLAKWLSSAYFQVGDTVKRLFSAEVL